MPPETDPNTDDPSGAGGDKDVEGLKAALQAERRARQAAEGRTRDLETSVAELRGRLDGLSAGGAARTKKAEPLSRAQLNKAVEDEKITQDEADTLWEKQIEERATAKAVEAAKRTIDTGTLASRVNADLARYKKAVPELADKESAAFGKAKTEFDYLVSMGEDKGDPGTELKAARAAFGAIDALESTAKPRARETFGETGGSGDPDGGGNRQDGYPKGTPAHLKAHYEDMLKKGMYPKGREDPAFKAEMDGIARRYGPKKAA